MIERGYGEGRPFAGNAQLLTTASGFGFIRRVAGPTELALKAKLTLPNGLLEGQLYYALGRHPASGWLAIGSGHGQFAHIRALA